MFLLALPITVAVLWFAAAALLYPAYTASGGSRKRPWVYALNTLLTLITGAFFLGVVTIVLAFGRGDPGLAVLMSALAIAAAALGGYAIAFTLNALSPARVRPLHLAAAAAVAGGVGAAGLLIKVASAGFGPNPLDWVFILLWIATPVGFYYHAAFAFRKKLRRHLRARCARCGYEKAAPLARCPECGERPPVLCHRCRRFADAAPGDPCPRCRATLGRRCWRCQYDWTGAEDRCPECGIWKPTEATA